MDGWMRELGWGGAGGTAAATTYVPGFWSVKGFKETVLTLMMNAV